MIKLKNKVTLLFVLLLISLLHAQTTNTTIPDNTTTIDNSFQLLDLTQLLKALNMTESDLSNITGDPIPTSNKIQPTTSAPNSISDTNPSTSTTNNNNQQQPTPTPTTSTTPTITKAATTTSTIASTTQPVTAGTTTTNTSKPITTTSSSSTANSNQNVQVQPKAIVAPVMTVASKTATVSAANSETDTTSADLNKPIVKTTPKGTQTSNSQTNSKQNKPTAAQTITFASTPTLTVKPTDSQVKTQTQAITSTSNSQLDKLTVLTPTATTPTPAAVNASTAASQSNFTLMDLSSLEALLGISSSPTTTPTNTTTSPTITTPTTSPTTTPTSTTMPTTITPASTSTQTSSPVIIPSTTPPIQVQGNTTPLTQTASSSSIPNTKSIMNSIDLSINKAASQSPSDSNTPVIGPGPLDPSLPPVLDLSKIVVDYNPNPKSTSKTSTATVAPSIANNISTIKPQIATPTLTQQAQTPSTVINQTTVYPTSSSGVPPSQTLNTPVSESSSKSTDITSSLPAVTTPKTDITFPTVSNQQTNKSSQTITDVHLISNIDNVQLPGWTVDVNKISDAKATELEYTSLNKQTLSIASTPTPNTSSKSSATQTSTISNKSVSSYSNSYSSSASAVPVLSTESSSKLPAIINNIPNLKVDYSSETKTSKNQQSAKPTSSNIQTITTTSSAVPTAQQNIQLAIQQTIQQAAVAYQTKNNYNSQQSYYQQQQPTNQQQPTDQRQQSSSKQSVTPVVNNIQPVYKPAISTSSRSRYQPTPTPVVETKTPLVQSQSIITKSVAETYNTPIQTKSAKSQDTNSKNINLPINNYQAPVSVKQTTSQLRKEDDDNSVQPYQRSQTDKAAINKIAPNYKTFSTSFIISNTDEHLNTLQEYLFNNYGNYISQGKLIAGFKLYNNYAPSIDYQLVYETSFGTFNSIITYFCDSQRIQLKSLSVINYYIMEIDYTNCKSKDNSLQNCEVCNVGYRNFMGRCRLYDLKCLAFLTDECGTCKNGYKLTKGVCV